jgi:hypothetical protein
LTKRVANPREYQLIETLQKIQKKSSKNKPKTFIPSYTFCFEKIWFLRIFKFSMLQRQSVHLFYILMAQVESNLWSSFR